MAISITKPKTKKEVVAAIEKRKLTDAEKAEREGAKGCKETWLFFSWICNACRY